MKLKEHGDFDDFLEMVTQFGYIVLFPSAFPLAAVFALISNIVEMLSDAFKITYIDQRPKSSKVRDIGSWKLILYGMSWVAILTNCWLFSMGSFQMHLWFPSLFTCTSSVDQEASADADIIIGSGRYVVLLVVGLEHFLGACAVLINIMILDIPAEVKDGLLIGYYQRCGAEEMNKK